MVALTGVAAWWAVRSRGAIRDQLTRPVARDLKRLTFDPGLQTDVTWSPDGQRIAYASDKEGNFDIWAQEARAGAAPIRLSSSPASDTQPAWSPNGDQIVFRSERDGGGLFVVPAAGGPERRVSSFGAYPTWRPDASEIPFSANSLGMVEGIHVVSASGDGMTREILSEFVQTGNGRPERARSRRPRATAVERRLADLLPAFARAPERGR